MKYKCRSIKFGEWRAVLSPFMLRFHMVVPYSVEGLVYGDGGVPGFTWSTLLGDL